MPVIDARCRQKLTENRIGFLHSAGFSLPENCEFEPPCSIKWMQIENSLSLGAFSYAVSGYYFACRIGRYVSIGEQVQVGRHNHPMNWATTSPFFFTDHAAVLDLSIDEARGVKVDDFMLNKPGQLLRYTEIGNDVWIGHGAFITPGVKIGHGAVVGAYSVVTRDVEPYSIVVGAPARVKRLRFEERVVERMLAVAWWRYAFWDLRGASTTEPMKFLDTVEDKIAAGKISEYKPDKVRLTDVLKPDSAQAAAG
jgi:acetyltransferase-like isoleucine patch superfamily enzyme